VLVTDRARPVLLVASQVTATLAMRLAAEARGICRLVWLVEPSFTAAAAPPRLLRRLGDVVELAAPCDAAAAAALCDDPPAGVVAFHDGQLLDAARIAERLGARFHSLVTAERLVDKQLQRSALEAAGIPTPRHVALPSLCGADGAHGQRHAQLAATLDDAGLRLPAVLKPRSGTASRSTYLVPDVETLASIAQSLPRAARREPYVLEEYLAGSDGASRFADYVSVESVVEDGRATHVAITGRQPLAPPFRETGLHVPSDLSPVTSAAVLGLAGAAARALEVKVGVLHTEIKLTPQGPRVIEVNGRVGGAVPELVEAAGIGVSLTRAAMRVALALPWGAERMRAPSRVAFKLVHQPPTDATRVLDVRGLEAVEALPQVSEVYLNRGPGCPVDWRRGFDEFVFHLYGTTTDHDELLSLRERIDRLVACDYERCAARRVAARNATAPAVRTGAVALSPAGADTRAAPAPGATAPPRVPAAPGLSSARPARS
jgi:biotin carboxylase